MSHETASGAGHEARENRSGDNSFQGGQEAVPHRPPVRSPHANRPDIPSGRPRVVSPHKDLPVREAAVLHALAHPDADVSPRLHEQIAAAESLELVARRREEPTTPTEATALTAIEEGANDKISGLKTPTKGEIAKRRVAIALVTVGVAGYAGYRAVDNAMEIPERVVDRALSEIPGEIGTEEVNVFGVDVTVPSWDGTLQKREDQVAVAQEKLDDTIDDTTFYGGLAVGSLLAGAAAGRLAKQGVDPVRAVRRRRGARTERQGWQILGTPKAELRRNYERRRQ